MSASSSAYDGRKHHDASGLVFQEGHTFQFLPPPCLIRLYSASLSSLELLRLDMNVIEVANEVDAFRRDSVTAT